MTEGGSERHERTGSKTTVVLGARDRERPGWLARMRTAQVQAAARDQIPLLCDSGETSASVANRALVMDLAGQRPADLGYAVELRASDLPRAHAGKTAEAAGHPRLATVSNGTARDILADVQTELHKMAHCCERRDPTSRPRRATRRRPASSCPSAKTRCYLATVLGRLGFVSAPRYGSWPDLVEGVFSKMIRQMPCGIRVSSKDELEERILRHHGEADVEPVVYRWKWNLSDIDPTTEELVVDALLSDGADKAR